jgi:GntR family transcriptional regulator, phosphonate transport system regulatory protein
MTQRAAMQTDLAANASLASGVSLWRRIADELEQSIARGAFKPGSKLPGEVNIAQRFGVNRHTVRRAIAALAQRGLVRAERGSGTFIEQRRIPYPIRPRTRFSEIVGSAGHSVSGHLIAHAVGNADLEVARRLKLKPGAPALRLELLRYADRIPVCAATTWLEAQRFPGAAKVYSSSNSITRMLAHFGVPTYARKSTRVTAAIAEAADAAALRIALGRPMLVVDSVDVDGDGIPVLTTHARFAADRLEFVIET